MTTVPQGGEDIRPGTHKRAHTDPTELDDYIGYVLRHHNASQVPPSDNVLNVQHVSEESFFHRNLRIPKNIQARHDQSAKLEGEVPVTFYNYDLEEGTFKHEVIPLQRLYENYGLAMAPEGSPSMDPPLFSRQDETDVVPRRLLRIMEFQTGYYAKDFLKAFSSEHIWDPENRGGSLRPGVSFRFPLGSQHFTVAISIPYLGVEQRISPPARNPQALDRAGIMGGRSGALKRLERLTDFREDPHPSWPRESLTLDQNKYQNADYDNQLGNSADGRFILVHSAGIILLNTTREGDGNEKQRLAIFRSCDDKNSGRVPLLPHQESRNALDAFLNVLSNTLKSSEGAVLENLRCKASNYSLDFQKFAKGSGAPKDLGGTLISDSATLSGELSAVIDVVRSQKRYIRDLQEFLMGLSTCSNRPSGSLRLSGNGNEGRSILLTKIGFLLEERQAFLEEVNEIFSGVKAIERSFYQLSTLAASRGIRPAIRRLRNETVFQMQRQGRKCRKAWWKRIIPSREPAPSLLVGGDDE